MIVRDPKQNMSALIAYGKWKCFKAAKLPSHLFRCIQIWAFMNEILSWLNWARTSKIDGSNWKGRLFYPAFEFKPQTQHNLMSETSNQQLNLQFSYVKMTRSGLKMTIYHTKCTTIRAEFWSDFLSYVAEFSYLL